MTLLFLVRGVSKRNKIYLVTRKLIYSNISTLSNNQSKVSNILPKFLKKKRQENVAVINQFGEIRSGRAGLGKQKYINFESLEKSIDKAFETKRLKAVCLLVNSPGGSAVQSELIANRIIKLGHSKNVEVISFVEDIAASGGYWLALAGSKIFVSKCSIIGSVGVLLQTFGLHDFIKRYNIEHRLYTAGENKLRLNPFAPEKESDVEKIKIILSQLHEHFIDYVKQQRGDKIKKDDKSLFNGDYWTGQEAVEYGLVDGIDDLYSYVKQNYGDDINIIRVNPTVKKGLAGLFGLNELSLEDIYDYMLSNRMKIM